MSEINMQQSQIPYVPYVNKEEYQLGDRKAIYIVKISETEQYEWNPATRKYDILKRGTKTTVDRLTGKMKSVTGCTVVGYNIQFCYQEDKSESPEVYQLAINAVSGVRFMTKFIEQRAKPITEFIPEEGLVLEKVKFTGAKFEATSILPLGA